jgi:GNAT superfamily N-acetyltransferase
MRDSFAGRAAGSVAIIDGMTDHCGSSLPADHNRPLTEKELVHGWRGTSTVRIRQATGADLDAVTRVAAIADAPFENLLQDALTEGTAGAGLRVGLRSGVEVYTTYMAERFEAHQRTDLLLPYFDAALVLVAEHREQGVLGGLIAYPPFEVAGQVVGTMRSVGRPENEVYLTVFSACMFVTRIKAIGVEEHARGAGIGVSLLQGCRRVYFQCGYQKIYGALQDTPGLDTFYQRASFTVHDYGEPVDLTEQFRFPARIAPGTRERFFHRDRPRER